PQALALCTFAGQTTLRHIFEALDYLNRHGLTYLKFGGTRFGPEGDYASHSGSQSVLAFAQKALPPRRNIFGWSMMQCSSFPTCKTGSRSCFRRTSGISN